MCKQFIQGKGRGGAIRFEWHPGIIPIEQGNQTLIKIVLHGNDLDLFLFHQVLEDLGNESAPLFKRLSRIKQIIFL